MARAIKPASLKDVQRVRRACELLGEARALLAQAGATRAVERVRAACRSADGALRHVEHRQRRTETPREEPFSRPGETEALEQAARDFNL